ncbi:hypothetical protein Hanom_Chr02g00140141 [Helianthus anomalus]
MVLRYRNVIWFRKWDSDLIEARHIKHLDENLNIIRLRFGEHRKPFFL